MQETNLRILLVDSSEDDYLALLDLFQQITWFNFELEWLSSYDAAVCALDRCGHDIYLFDYHLGEKSGLDLLMAGLSAGCRAPVIILTGQEDRDQDILAMHAGAADYLIKNEVTPSLLERS